ncbi:HlyD family secretion protein [Solimonas aquatica]|uniref:HlyD family secretion protein n=1 Tax=Solimonas aquatica TaxID=489703 RepID=A0A1H9HAB1_9GAMM|nr:HlyD family efflux transporter periplasmic adaptor subunit [Solimonas aquatica]SEQ59309.1 HlyD family secretion protein [Solimonas aquatica]
MNKFGVFVLLMLSACTGEQHNSWQAYAEGEFVYIASSQSGRLDELTVKRGDQLAAGAPLFRLESQRETAARQQARGQLAVAQAQLRDLQSGRRPAELAVIQAQLAQAQAAARLSAEQLRRDEAQLAVAAISQARLDASRAGATADEARVQELQRQLQVARLPGREQQLAAQAAQVEAAAAALRQADWALEQKTVKATQAGLVYDTLYRLGEWVPAGSPVLRMLPPQNLKLRFFVSETELGRLRTGMALRARCDGCAREITAHISFISPQAEYTPPVIYSNQTRDKLVFMIEARPQAQDAGLLHPGQPLQLSLAERPA